MMKTIDCWIDKKALEHIKRLGDYKAPLETGGCLIGYRSGGDIVITNVTRAGKFAKHTLKTFNHDHVSEQHQCDEFYNKSEGRLKYIGDWHTHPEQSMNFSPMDYESIKKVALYKDALTLHPIMLIAGYDFINVAIYEYIDGVMKTLNWKVFNFDKEGILT